MSREEEAGNKHERVLEEAFRNLLIQSGSDTKIRVISRERAEIIFRRDLLAFFSRQLREIIVSLSKTVTCSTDSDLVVHMPEFSMLTITKLRSLLEEGFVRGPSSDGEMREVLETALSLGVDMNQLGRGGELYPPLLPDPISTTPVITSTVSVKQEILSQDQSDGQTGEPSPVFTSDQGEEHQKAGTNSNQSKPTNQQAQFGCQKCRRNSKSLKNLKIHYIIEHYSEDLSHWIQGDQCLECNATFHNSTKLLIHVGSAHKKVEDLLARDGLLLDHPVSQNDAGRKPTSSSKSKSRSQKRSPKGKNITVTASNQSLALTLQTEEEAVENITLELGGSVERERGACNYSLQCESCQVELKSGHQLEEHMCRHFMEELEVRVDHSHWSTSIEILLTDVATPAL